MISISLCPRLTQTAYGPATHFNWTEQATRYRHKSHRIGGYLEASFTLSEADFSSDELADLFNRYVGSRIREITAGLVSWEGFIEEMRFYSGDVEHQISVAPEYCRNRIKVIYTDDAGTRAETAYSENTDSSDIFGEINWIESLAGTTTAGAVAWRDTYLLTHAWPRSRIIGGDARETKGDEPLLDELHITCKGYKHSMGWRYQEIPLDDTATNLITTLVGLSEFVTAERIETNASTYHVDGFPVYCRLDDAIAEVVEQGDTSGNLWEGGVYADQEFIYEQADTDYRYKLKDGELLSRSGAPAYLSAVKPGFLLYSVDSPTGWAKVGASDWDDPKIGYVDEVTYIRGVDVDELRMHYFGTSPSAHVLAKQMRNVNR